MRVERGTTRALWCAWLLPVFLTACGDDFDPYNLVAGDFRILAVKADPPWLSPGETATLEPLIYRGASGEPALNWSWCPVAVDGGCAVTPEVVGEALGIPGLDFDLGSEAQASLTYPASEDGAAGLCAALRNMDWPPFVARPNCETGLTVSVQLTADLAGRSETAIKELRLSLNQEQNENPRLTGLNLAAPAGEQEITAIRTDAPPVFKFGQAYQLSADLPAAVSEAYVDQATGESARESLVFTWFVTAGETDATRTRWSPDDQNDEGLTNNWTLPAADDFAGDRAEIYLVVRDGRGGIGWLSRTIMLSE